MSDEDPVVTGKPRLKMIRGFFAAYAIALVIGTHYPGIRIEGAMERPDLLVHVAAFGFWAFVLMMCRFFGSALSLRNVLVSAGIALVYAGLDEVTQGIPGLNRTVAIEDFLAGAVGVVGAVVVAGLAVMAKKRSGGYHGPPIWVVSIASGFILGGLATTVLAVEYVKPGGDGHGQVEAEPGDELVDEIVVSEPAGDGHEGGAEASEHASAEEGESHGRTPVIPLVLCAPFAALLLSIALMPFISERFWHHHFPDFALFLGSLTTGYYLLQFNEPYSHGMSYGLYQMKHVANEYVAFIALVGGLFVASGGVVIDIRGRGRPMANVALLAFGAVIANVVGTTGASMLLIRPFMRLNEGRLRAIHIVMFIFIVSNCGGALTPIGDPPLYLGYLKGVPFFWTVEHLWPMWLVCVGTLLVTFFIIDSVVERQTKPEVVASSEGGYSIRVRGLSGLIALTLIIAAVFIDPFLEGLVDTHGVPVGPLVQIVVAAGAYFIARRENLEANEFSFFPVQEVGLLFVGIFATMAPALGYLAAHGGSLGIDSPTKFYFATGSLSGVLDNAPTYANFLQIAFGPQEMTTESLRVFVASEHGARLLRAVSLGAVFFGAFTYIGNGPNFMVKALAERGGVRMPSFFGYVVRAILFLTPAILLVWAIFIR